MPPLDIAVAGCGPTGMAAALLLARDGHRVRIYERFERARPIGSGLILQPTGQAVLARLGLLDGAVAAGARLERLFGRVEPLGRTVLDVRYSALRRSGRFGLAVHRATLFDLLHRALAAAHVPVETAHEVERTELAGSRRRIVFADGRLSPPFDLVVDALGSASALAGGDHKPLAYGALWATIDWVAGDGFDPAALEQRYRRAQVMAGVLPTGTAPGSAAPQTAFFWSLRGDRLASWQAAGLAAWKDEVRALWPATAPLLDRINETGQLTFARYRHRTLRRPAETALIHIGDAWHSTSPQLGQGANMGLLDAWALAMALAASDDLDAGLARAVSLRRRHVRLYQAMSRLFTPVYQSDSRLLPLVRDRIAGPLSRIPPVPAILAAMVSGTVGNPLARLGL